MNYRFAKLLSFDVRHDYFLGTNQAFLSWEPTAACVGVLEHLRLLYRPQRNGGVVLYEVNTEAAGSEPLISLDDEVVLTFSAQATDTAFGGATEPPSSPERPFFFSNRAGALVSGVGRPHEGAVAGSADQVRVVKPFTMLQFTGVSETEALRVRDANGDLVLEKDVTPVEGVVEAALDLAPWAPGAFEVQLGLGASERIYADAGLPARRPAVVLELVLRPQGSEGFAILEPDGAPVEGGRVVQVSWQARATVWRYVVVPRNDPDIELADLRIQHTPESGAPFEFTRTAPLVSGHAEAVLFESTTMIGLRALPYRGLVLQTRPTAAGEFVSALTDLPNPRPETLSPASTSVRPISEVFVYL